jgi:Cu2+-containing amine oxidase
MQKTNKINLIIDLWEPSKDAVRTHERTSQDSAQIPREARVEVIEASGEVFWGIVSLSESKISEWHQVPKKEGQPAFQVDEHEQIEKIVKADEKVRSRPLPSPPPFYPLSFSSLPL